MDLKYAAIIGFNEAELREYFSAQDRNSATKHSTWKNEGFS